MQPFLVETQDPGGALSPLGGWDAASGAFVLYTPPPSPAGTLAVPNPPAGSVRVFTDGTTLYSRDAVGNVRQAGSSAFVPPAATTVTGTTSLSKLMDGLAPPVSTLTPGAAFTVEAWGVVTTTVDTQTVTITLYLGGTGGTALLSFPNSNPNPSATVTGVAWGLSARFVVYAPGLASASGLLSMNFFPVAFNQNNAVNISALTGNPEIVIGATPSATALSITSNTGLVARVS